MLTISSSTEITAISQKARSAQQRIGFVPTMGALHPGHISLVRAARAQSDMVMVSIFVNPLQFGPKEDFSKYPRTLEHDCALLAAENVDYVFTPSVEEMYPQGASTWVTVEGITDRLDGRSRPGHFRGVSTVVAKLFHIVQPDLAFFGQKDAAQAAIIRRMVHDLNFDVRIVVCPTVREPDGLAMSSRNAYLDPAQRQLATALYRALMRVQTLAGEGERDSGRLLAEGKQVIAGEPSIRLDYLEIVDRATLEPVAETSGGALVAVAAYVGETRLIDNIVLSDRGLTGHLSQPRP
jgi:pantoate--beta-alanine ligase